MRVEIDVTPMVIASVQVNLTDVEVPQDTAKVEVELLMRSGRPKRVSIPAWMFFPEEDMPLVARDLR